MTDDKGRPGDGNPNGNGDDAGDAAYGYGQGQDPYGQQNQDPYGQYGQQNQDPYGQYGQQGQDPYGQQNQWGQDQYGNQGYQGYQGEQGYQGYQQYGGYPGQGPGQWGAGAGQWGQQSYGDPGVGVAQPGGEEPPTSPVMSGPAQFNITQPLSTAFKRVNANIGPWLGFATAAIGAIIVVMVIFMAVIFGGMFASLSDFDPATGTSPNSGGLVAAFGAIALMYPVLFALMFVIGVFFHRGAFEEVDGRRASFGTFFRVTRWGSLLGGWFVSGLIALAAMIPGYALIFLGAGMSTRSEGAGTALIILAYLLLLAGGILVTPITSLIPMLVMDGRAKALEAPAAAWNLIKGRFWPVLGALLLASLVGSVGVLLCYVGAIYTMPIQLVSYVEIYRQLIGGRRPVPLP